MRAIVAILQRIAYYEILFWGMEELKTSFLTALGLSRIQKQGLDRDR